MKIVFLNELGYSEHSSMSEIFQELSKNGAIITSVADGKIKYKDVNDKEVIASYGFMDGTGTKDLFIKDVNDYKKELAGSMSVMKSHGFDLSEEQTSKLKKQFEFLKEKSA